MKNPLAPKEPKGREKIEHYNAILIEELTSQFKFVTEHMMSIEERLAKKMDKKFGQPLSWMKREACPEYIRGAKGGWDTSASLAPCLLSPLH